jgi:hypothetical protein
VKSFEKVGNFLDLSKLFTGGVILVPTYDTPTGTYGTGTVPVPGTGRYLGTVTYYLWESGCTLVVSPQLSSIRVQQFPPVSLDGLENSHV